MITRWIRTKEGVKNLKLGRHIEIQKLFTHENIHKIAIDSGLKCGFF